MISKHMKELVLNVLDALRECAVFHTAVVTWDSFSGDGYAGYISASTIGISDLTKYHWLISEQPSWQQHNQIQAVTSTALTMRCWQMTSPSDGKAYLMRNTKPAAFKLIGIRKVGGGYRVNFMRQLCRSCLGVM